MLSIMKVVLMQVVGVAWSWVGLLIVLKIWFFLDMWFVDLCRAVLYCFVDVAKVGAAVWRECVERTCVCECV